MAALPTVPQEIALVCKARFALEKAGVPFNVLCCVSIENRLQLPEACGLYFVEADALCIYVGISAASIRDRLAGHHRLRQILELHPLASITALEIPRLFLRKSERILIRALAPKLNGVAMRNVRSRPDVLRAAESVLSGGSLIEALWGDLR